MSGSIKWFRMVIVLLVGLVFVAPAGSVAVAQTPEAAGAGLFDGVAFEDGVVPTIFGEVALPDQVERVITLTDGALDAMLTLGILPVGMTASSNGTSAAAYLAELVPEDQEYVGGWGELDIEKIVGLQPDLILTDRYILEDEYTTLSAIAPVVATQEVTVDSPDALQQWEYELLVWGYAVGQEDAARTAILELRERAADVRVAVGEHQGESVVVFRPQAEFPVVMSHAWMTGTILTWAGFTGNDFTENLAPPHSGRDVSLEQLQLLSADWLFAAARDQEMRDSLQLYENNPLIQDFVAVREGQIALVPGDLWSGATGVLAGHAMLDDIQRIVVDGER